MQHDPRSHAKRLAATMKSLARNAAFIDALKCELGQQLLGSLLERHEELLFKIADMTAGDREKAEFTAIRDLIVNWSERIADYERKLREVEAAFK